MKIKKLASIVLMITILMILTIKIEATTGIVNSDTVKLRKKPDTSSTVLDLINKGDKVEVLEHEDGWYKIKATTSLGKVTGYVKENTLDIEDVDSKEPEEAPIETTPVEGEIPTEETPVENQPEVPAEDTVDIATQPEENIVVPPATNQLQIEVQRQYILTQDVKIKALPLINSIEKATITGNIKVVEILNDWSRIENDVESGWIRTNTLKKSLTTAEVENPAPEVQPEQPVEPEVTTPEEPVVETPEVTEPEVTEPNTNTTPEEETINKVGYVSTEGLRVRKGPTTDSDEIDSLKRNDKVQIIGKSGNWYKIDLKGKTGYVSAKYISDTKLPETTSRDGSTIRNETITQEPPKEEVKQPTEEPKVEEPPLTSAPVESTPSTTGAAIVEYAKQYLGYKYVSGGASPSKGFDCSGFTTYVYKHFGISVNRTSRDQIKNGVAVAKSDLQLGDLVIFNNDANTSIGHVGIYIGDGNFIHASNPKDGVKITTLLSGYYQVRYVGARRVI